MIKPINPTLENFLPSTSYDSEYTFTDYGNVVDPYDSYTAAQVEEINALPPIQATDMPLYYFRCKPTIINNVGSEGTEGAELTELSNAYYVNYKSTVDKADFDDVTKAGSQVFRSGQYFNGIVGIRRTVGISFDKPAPGRTAPLGAES